MEVSQRENLLREIRPFVKEMIEEIVAESFRKGEMKELFEDLVLAKAMEETVDHYSIIIFCSSSSSENYSASSTIQSFKYPFFDPYLFRNFSRNIPAL